METRDTSRFATITLGEGGHAPTSADLNDFVENLSDPDGENLLVNVLKVGLLPDFPDLPDGDPSPRRIALLVNHHGDESVKSIVAFLAPFADVRIFEIPEADTARYWLENRTD